MSGASGRQRVQVACFDKFLIAQPDSETLTKFSMLAKPLFQSVYVLAQKNANLRHTRDLLLPKLISGELNVEGLDVEMDVEDIDVTAQEVSVVETVQQDGFTRYPEVSIVP